MTGDLQGDGFRESRKKIMILKERDIG